MTTKTCSRCNQTKPVDNFGKRARMRDGYLSHCRPCDSARKLELRAADSDRPVEPPDSIYRVWINTERLIPHFSAWCDRNTVSSMSDSTTRRVFGVMQREQSVMRFDTADRLLIELGLDWLWHTPQADGGLADIYECEGAQKRALVFSRPRGGPADSVVLDGDEGTNSLEEAA